MNVAAVLMEILRAAGVRYLFGNPGTTELPFLDALPDSRLEYVLGLQAATAVAAADGYAQASGQVGVANVHVGPGGGGYGRRTNADRRAHPARSWSRRPSRRAPRRCRGADRHRG